MPVISFRACACLLLLHLIKLAKCSTIASLSQLGTLNAPLLPKHLSSPAIKNRDVASQKVYANAATPWTGVTRHYNFNLARGRLAPDGVLTTGIYVNGQFPGPTIEANWGDIISVTVTNNITNPEEGTALHWHGMSQYGTQWYDGVPGVTQCPILPGDSSTYTFQADKYGSTWWHAHYSAQYSAGSLGPLIVYGPEIDAYDVDIGPLLLGDHYHRDYFSIVEDAASSSPDLSVYVPKSDNSLINGRNPFNCSLSTTDAPCKSNASYAEFLFVRGKTHRLRLMNTGAAALLHFSIDGHNMRVIATDMTPVVPYETEVVTLHVGQRADVLVEGLIAPTHNTYWLRSTISLNCSETQTTQGLGIITYDRKTAREIPTSTRSDAAAKADEKSFLCKNDDLERTVPRLAKPVAVPDAVETIVVDLLTNATGHHVWIQNNETQTTDYNTPALPLIMNGTVDFPPTSGLHSFPGKKVIRLVMNTVYQAVHPMHLHGHDMQVLAEGPGPWDGKTITNPLNPLRRDTHVLRRYGHLVVQFEADNPGVWNYHCHIAWHASMGYNWIIVERPEDLKLQKLPDSVHDTCVKWDKWSKSHVVDQIDSGI